MSKTMAIVGAGPGLGLSLARRFAAEDFEIVLLSRDPSKLDFDARKVAADVTDREGLADALRSLGPIDVLEYSPPPTFPHDRARGPDAGSRARAVRAAGPRRGRRGPRGATCGPAARCCSPPRRPRSRRSR